MSRQAGTDSGADSTLVMEPLWLRVILITLAIAIVGIFLLLPLVTVFQYALQKGMPAYLRAISHPEAVSAIRLTIFAALIAVPLNVVFGVSVAWLVTKFRFPGRTLLMSVIDLPLAVSPVVAGMMFVLLFGSRGWFGHVLSEHGIRIIFAFPGIVLATIFVTLPFVACEVIPILESIGATEEEAALTLGANPRQMFWKITVPNVRWGLLYGIILCNARAMGEFGAVSVVSGHIRGSTNTLPLYVEILYNEYNFAAAFAAASILTLLALVTLVLKAVLEWKLEHDQTIGSSQ